MKIAPAGSRTLDTVNRCSKILRNNLMSLSEGSAYSFDEKLLFPGESPFRCGSEIAGRLEHSQERVLVP